MDEDGHLPIFCEECFVLVEEDGRGEGCGGVSSFFGGGTIADLLDVGIVDDGTWGFLEVLETGFGALGRKENTSRRLA